MRSLVICFTSCVVVWCSSRERSLSSLRFGPDMVYYLVYLVEGGWGLKVTFNSLCNQSRIQDLDLD